MRELGSWDSDRGQGNVGALFETELGLANVHAKDHMVVSVVYTLPPPSASAFEAAPSAAADTSPRSSELFLGAFLVHQQKWISESSSVFCFLLQLVN
mmetsp:Transcript_22314/g.33866  ORF Transcript_22314/g.33866 Transcript_22314/m.33866 type:complete len:97 (+) Transcript_22314:597-887(+)